MIQVKDLRIGNLVLHELETCLIEGIYNGGWAKVRDINPLFNKSVYDAEYKDIKPIHLTPEVLEKCGFKDGLNGEGYRNDNFMRIGRFSDGYAFMNDDKSKIGIGFRYLHQLQNLYYALTGEEITIKV